MALSNWDTLAFDSEGDPGDGRLVIKYDDGGYRSVDIYKNWVYVYSTKMWVDGHSYVHPCIAEIQDGNVDIAGFRIQTKRGPQQSIFVLAETGWSHQGTLKRMCGLGCYGYSGEDWIGVDDETLEAFFDFMANLISGHDKEGIAYLKKIVASEPRRFNQGDAFFSRHFNLGDVSTKIGESEDTIMSKFLKS